MIAARLDEIEAPDDRTFRIRLKQPFPKMLFALGKNNTPVALIMPERIAKTDPFKLITEYVGSGPMSLQARRMGAGQQAVFERFDGYVPRDEPADWLAGGKRMMFDRIEWLIIPDAATAAAALQNGEVDWWENPIPDLVPLLKRNRNVQRRYRRPARQYRRRAASTTCYPPFNDVRVRRAVHDGAEPGGLHARRGRRRRDAVEERCRASSRRARRSTPSPAARC